MKNKTKEELISTLFYIMLLICNDLIVMAKITLISLVFKIFLERVFTNEN